MPEPTGGWQSRLVPVPVWALLLVGAAGVGGTGALVMRPASASSPADSAPALTDVRTYLIRIDGRLDGMERSSALVASELVSLRRDVNTLRADVDAIQRGGSR